MNVTQLDLRHMRKKDNVLACHKYLTEQPAICDKLERCWLIYCQVRGGTIQFTVALYVRNSGNDDPYPSRLESAPRLTDECILTMESRPYRFTPYNGSNVSTAIRCVKQNIKSTEQLWLKTGMAA